MATEVQHLVKMANQIALNVAPQDDVELLAAKLHDHIQRFWTTAMREQLVQHGKAGGEGCHPAVMRMLELDPAGA
ncbi:MAG: formate dehydrogenase subunit delta [Pseudomonadota bacterium]